MDCSKIKQLREQMGLTKAELGVKIGRSESWVSRLESGEFKNIKPELQDRLAPALGINPQQLRNIIYGNNKDSGGGIFKEIERLNAYRNFQRQIGVIIIPVNYTFSDGVGREYGGEDEVLMAIDNLNMTTSVDTIHAIRVKDGSLMSHGIRQDDCLFVDPKAVVEDGGMYLVRMNGDYRIVKIYKHREGNIIVIGVTDGKYYEYNTSDIEIKGRVIGFSGFHPL